MARLKYRLKNFLIAVDQLFLSILTLGKAAPDETMSSAAWRLEQKGRWQGRLFRPIIDFLFLWLEPDHCRLSYEAEIHRWQLPPEMRRIPN